MAVVLSIKEIGYLVVELFYDWVRSLMFLFGTLTSLFALIPSWIEKGPCYTLRFIRRLLSYFEAKTFSFNPVLQINAIIVLFDLFIKFGCYYISLCL